MTTHSTRHHVARVLLMLIVFGLFLPETSADDGQRAGYRAGMAKLKITPERPGWLLAYDRHQKAEGVESDLWLRALALEDATGRRAVIVSADILGFPPTLSNRIRQQARSRFALLPGHLLLAASHTHNGPVLPERLSLSIYHDFDDQEAAEVHRYADVLARQVIEVIARALAKLSPVRLRFGMGSAEFAKNRRLSRNPLGHTDQDVPVLCVESETAELRAVVFTYACHGTTVMADRFFKYFGDYPGVAADELERQLPGTLALFVAGCGGDINPEPRGSVELAQLHGRHLAQSVLRVVTGDALRPVAGLMQCSARAIELPLAKPPSRSLLIGMLSHKKKVHQRFAREMLRQLDDGGLPTAVPYPIHLWRFGSDLTLIALSGEVCVDYALRLKRELGPTRTWVVGYTTEVACYIPSEQVLAEGGYEAGWREEFGRRAASPSMATYGWPTPFAPGLEKRIVSTVHAMTRVK